MSGPGMDFEACGPHYCIAPAVQEQAGVNNPAAVLYSANDMRYENHHIPAEIPPGHVRVQMRAVGICGSDVHFYKKVQPSCLLRLILRQMRQTFRLI